MKNHYHLLLSERRDGGIAFFMRKLNVGYDNIGIDAQCRQTRTENRIPTLANRSAFKGR